LRTVASATAGLDSEPHLNVYMAPEAGEDDARRVQQAMSAMPGVGNVKFVARAAAFEELKATSHLAEILATLDRNPLPDAFTVRIRGEAAHRAADVKGAIQKLPGVDQVSADFEWSRRLGQWIRFGNRLLAVAGAVLAGAVVLIVAHLIRLQALTRREEIEVSQLVGATAADVRRPLLYHGALQGFLSAGLAVGMAAAATAAFRAQMLVLAPEYAAELKVIFLDPMTCAAIVGGGALLGLMGAWTAAQREIRRFARA
jgi:cell division transport system permease protein